MNVVGGAHPTGLEALKLESEQSKEVAGNVFEGLSGITKPLTNPASFTTSVPLEVKQVLLAASPWLLFCLFFIPGYFKGKEGNASVIGGSLVMALFIGLGGYLIPPDWGSWVAFGLYPFGANLIIFMLLAWIGRRKRTSP